MSSLPHRFLTPVALESPFCLWTRLLCVLAVMESHTRWPLLSGSLIETHTPPPPFFPPKIILTLGGSGAHL